MSMLRHSWCLPHMREEAASALDGAKKSLDEALAARTQAKNISERTMSSVKKNGFREKFEEEMRRRGTT